MVTQATIEQLLLHLDQAGVELWVEEGRLRSRSPEGAITPTLREQIRLYRERLIETLQQVNHYADTASIQRAVRPEQLPLSYAQQRLWFLEELGSNAAYNMPAVLEITGQLDLVALQQTLSEIVRRHESLRTTFANEEGSPRQQIQPPARFALPVVDLRSLAGESQQTEIKRLCESEAITPFNLQHDVMARAQVLQLADEHFLLLLTLHHIASDGWSIGIFVKELAALYRAFSQGQPSPLPELAIQYADFALWQRGYLQGALLDQQLSYWQKQLAGAPALLQLPTDRPRPAQQSFRGAAETVALAAGLTQRLRQLSQANGATLYMTLLTACQILLARYSGQQDIVVGTPIANRHRQELEPLIGFFVNTLALRADLSDNPSFLALLAQVKATTQAAYDHQDLPFERLVEALAVERTLHHNPLVQVMFALQNAPMSMWELPGVQVKMAASAVQSTRFDLEIHCWEMDDILQVYAIYNRDLFDAATIERLLGHFQTLLGGIVANPQASVADLPLLTQAERHQLLVDWNNTATTYPQAQCIHQLFEEQAARTPEAVAVVMAEDKVIKANDVTLSPCHPVTLTYAELNERANQLAHHLQSLGVGVDDRVGLCLERGPDMIVALLAILKAGAGYVPFDPTYPSERLAFMVENAQLRLLITTADLRPQLAWAERVTCFTEWTQIAHYPTSQPVANATPETLLYCLYTSGSTGQPKGVVMPHRAITNLIRWQMDYTTVAPDARTLQYSPLNFDVSCQEIFATLCAGGTLVLVEEERRRDPHALLAYLAEQRVQRLYLPFVALQQLAEAAEGQMPASLQEVNTAGEQLQITPALAHWFRHSNCRLQNHYGPTETHVVTAFALPPSVEEWHSLPSIGRPIANTQIYILDAALQPTPIGIAGELYIAGLALADGYNQRPDLTHERFRPHPFGPGRVYKTGDLARWLPDGNIEYLGRIDQQVKIRGFRIELGEIEALLRQHPQVQEAVVVAQDDALGGKRLVAYIVHEISDATGEQTGTEAQPPFNVTALRTYLQSKLPEYMVPAAFVELHALPLTPSGKVDRKALPAPEMGTLSAEHYAPPTTPTEVALAEIWSSLLGVAQMGLYDSFFQLGGHSLLATQVISRIRQRFAADLPLRLLFEQPTLAAFAQAIDARRISAQPAYQPIPPADRSQPLPLSYAQQRLWFLEEMGSQAAYNMPAVLEITGNLDLAALQQTLSEIVRRHESLRTTFTNASGTPCQIIQPPAILALPRIDLCSLAEENQQAAVKQLCEQEAVKPFHLRQELLIRAQVVQLAAERCLLLLTIHHIASDGWSIGILVKELATLYAAFRQDQPSPLPELAIQYADFAIWQRDYLQGERLQEQLSYWQNQLADAPALLQLPTDRPRPAQQSFRGDIVSIALDAKLTQRLRQLSQANGSTLYMTLLTAFQILLARYSGQHDIVVGSPIANRHRQELEPLIGFFVNTLALRANLSDNPSFLALLAQVKATTQAAYDHQDLPFERLVEEIAPERNLQHNPLVQVIFALQNAPIGAWELPGVQVKMAAIEVQSTRFDLEVHCWEMGDILQVSAIYNRDLFEPATIGRLLDHFQTLLAGVIANPQATVTELPLLTPAERHQLLVEWNNTTTAYPKDKCIHHLFEEQAARTPDAVAIIMAEDEVTRWQEPALSMSKGDKMINANAVIPSPVTLTYAELDEQANQLAHHLQSLGVTTETLVGICVERSVEMVVGLLAILKAGGAYVPLDPSYPQERLAFMLQEIATPVLLTQSHWVAHLPPTTAQIVCLDQLDTLLTQECRKKPVDAGNRSNNLAYVMYTSGSTGQPKGACVLHRNVVRLVKETDFMHLGSDEVFLPLASPAFDATTLELWGPLLNGGRIVLLPPAQPTLSEIAAAIKTYQVTSLWLTAGLFHLMVDEQLEALRPLRQLLAGGDVLSPTHVQRVRQAIPTCRLINGYGPTENTTFTCCYTIPPHWTAESAVPIGRPIANTQVYLLDAELQPVPIGVAGELYAGGDGVAQGYYQRPELTTEKFIANPFGAGQLYKTGDLCRWRADGDPSTGSGHCIEFLGRIDQQVKIRGFRIELGEIESVLSQHPAVQEAVVVAREETPGNKQLVAYLVAAQADAESQEEHVSTWQSLYEESYSQPTSAAALDLNLTGWNSSYTGQPIPTGEMVEWVENTVAEIRSLQPQRVLEIGCGTGLLLARLAPDCEVYYGVDYSHQALAHVARLRAADDRLAHVQLEQRLADDFQGLREGSFDCIILNSIVQYFPTVDYLLRVLAGATRLLVPGGVIYVGDVRNYQLLAAYHASVQLYQAEATLPLAELHARIQQRMQDEEELLIDPAFFHALPSVLPAITNVRVQVKRGWAHNELTRFRYQVVLCTGEQTSNSTPIVATYAEMDWQADEVTLATLRSRLQQTHDGLLVRQIPNARLQPEAYTLHTLDENGLSTVAHLRQQLAQLAPALEPEALWQLGEELGYAVVVGNGSQPGQVDALFLPPHSTVRYPVPRSAASPKPWSRYANNPLFGKFNRMLIPQIRTYLQSQLPDYMLPAAFVLLERLPLTPNGKVDRKALPAPKRLRVVDSREFAPPSTATERALAEIWQQLLDLPQVSIHDNFFDLGGHSLLATQVVSRINATWAMQLPLKSLFERPTVQGLAERLDVLWMIAQQATADDADAMEEGEL